MSLSLQLWLIKSNLVPVSFLYFSGQGKEAVQISALDSSAYCSFLLPAFETAHNNFVWDK